MTQIKAIQKVRNFAMSALFGDKPGAMAPTEQGQVYGLLTVLKKAIDQRLGEIKPVLVESVKAMGEAHTDKSDKLEFEGGEALITVSPATPDTKVWDAKAIKAAVGMFDLDMADVTVTVVDPPPPPREEISQEKIDALVAAGKLPESAVKKFKKVQKGKVESFSLRVTLDQEIQADIMGRLGNGK